MIVRHFVPTWLRKARDHAYAALKDQEPNQESKQTDEQRHVPQQQVTWSFPRKFFICLLLGFIVVENSFWLYTRLVKAHAQIVPSFDMEDVILLKNHEWEVGMSEETNTLWETGVPGTTGWVQFASPRTLGLPTGLPSFDPDRPDDEVFIVTWGHQHHCLKILRKAFWELVYDNSTLNGLDMFGNSSNGSSNAQIHHLMHCWDYLRQTVSCQSDLTIEGIGRLENPLSLDIDGYHVKHQCKNRAAVSKWLIQHAPTSKNAYLIP